MSASTDIRTTVAIRISKISPVVTDRVIEHLVQQELEKRTSAVIKGIEKLLTLERESFKLKADMVSYNEDGSVKDIAFSEARLKERKENQEKTEKLRNALDAAIGKGDMDKLYNLVK